MLIHSVTMKMTRQNFLLDVACFILCMISSIHGFALNPTIKKPISSPSTKSLLSGRPTYKRTSNVKITLNLGKENYDQIIQKFTKKISQSFMSSLFIMSNLLVVTSGIIVPQPAQANESRLIGEIPGSGIFFKDVLNVESFDDPKVKGVTIYISNFQRPLTERLQKDFFSDPSYASLSCARSGTISIADNIYAGKDGEEVFEESKSLLFKTLRVKRIYDKEKNTAVYVSFNTRLNKNDDDNKSRFKSSICAIGLD